jgi:hypothetical protein
MKSRADNLADNLGVFGALAIGGGLLGLSFGDLGAAVGLLVGSLVALRAIRIGAL